MEKYKDDYSTWWRKGVYVKDELCDIYRKQIEYNWNWLLCFPQNNDLDRDDMDCVEEQLWAIRENIA